MKKLLSIVLVLVLALSMSVTAFAAGDDDTGNITITQDTDKTGKTNVEYTVNPAYTVTIPPSVTIGGSNGSNTVTVSAEGVKIATGNSVVVKLTGINESETATDFTVALTDDMTQTLAYTVSASGNVESSDSNNNNSNVSNQDISKNTTVLTVEAGLNNEKDENGKELNNGASTGSTTLTFALADTAVVKYAGKYTGTVTFTVSVESGNCNGDTTTNP